MICDCSSPRHGRRPFQDLGPVPFAHQVDLVYHDDERLAEHGQVVEQVFVMAPDAPGRFEDDHQEIGLLRRLEGDGPLTLTHGARGVRPGRVNHAEEAGIGLLVLAGGAWHRADGGAVFLLLHQLVEQRGLPDIGRPDNGNLLLGPGYRRPGVEDEAHDILHWPNGVRHQRKPAFQLPPLRLRHVGPGFRDHLACRARKFRQDVISLAHQLPSSGTTGCRSSRV